MEHPVVLARKARGISQAELARLTKLDPSTVCKIEKGRPGSVATYQLMGQVLGVDYRQLMPADGADGTAAPRDSDYSESTGG